MYLNSGFLGQISKKYRKSLVAKIKKFDSVRVWLSLSVSRLDFNVLVIPIMHFDLGMFYRYDNVFWNRCM
jgi:hypothetical protein